MLACLRWSRSARKQTGRDTGLAPGAEKAATRFARWCGLLCCLLVLVVGCAHKRRAAEHAEVSGRVLYKNKPVTGGSVAFVASDGFASSGVIDEKGNYTISAPVGDVRIGVDNRGVGQKPMAAASKGAGRPDAEPPTPIKGTYRQIPEKYYDPSTSGLTYTVKSGPQTHDIELSD